MPSGSPHIENQMFFLKCFECFYINIVIVFSNLVLFHLHCHIMYLSCIWVTRLSLIWSGRGGQAWGPRERWCSWKRWSARVIWETGKHSDALGIYDQIWALISSSPATFVCLFLFLIFLTTNFCRVLLDPLALQDLKESKVTAAHQDRCVCLLNMCISMCAFAHNVWFDWHNAFNSHPVLFFIFLYFHCVLQSVVGPPGKKGEPVSCCHGYLIGNTVKINLSHLHDR